MMSAVSVYCTLQALRARRPLVHCITNHVTSGLVANCLLALGAVPAMVEDPEEVGEFVRHADALAVNLGTLSAVRAASMRLATGVAHAAGIPWVLDPVAAGAVANRAALARELLANRPAVIRGNASEIPALLPGYGARSGRGPDASAAVQDAVPAAKRLAHETGATVALTGAVDHVFSADHVVRIHTGHSLMARVSGVGCAATAIVAACLAVQPDRYVAASHGLRILGAAGANAGRVAAGPGSYVPALLDALATLDEADFISGTLRADR